MKLGIAADAFSNLYEMEMSTYAMREHTVVIGLSSSGYSTDVVKMMERAKELGALTISITSQQDSPLSHVSDMRLLIPASEDINGASCSINEVSSFYLLDVLLQELKSNEMEVNQKSIM